MKNSLQVLTCLSVLVTVTHQAAHSHGARKGSAEREDDGAFSPKDHHHGHGEEHDNSFDHEAILGSKAEAEEFDELSPEEAKRRLYVLLGKMDRNQDESIDRNVSTSKTKF